MINDLKVSTILFILDDDKDTLDLLVNLIRKAGFENVVPFTDYKDLSEALTADINICVIDHYLKIRDFTGLDVLKAVKKKNRYNYVLILTGQEDRKVVIQYLNNKADYYIDKNDRDYEKQLIEQMTIGLEEVYYRAKHVPILFASDQQIK